MKKGLVVLWFVAIAAGTCIRIVATILGERFCFIVSHVRHEIVFVIDLFYVVAATAICRYGFLYQKLVFHSSWIEKQRELVFLVATATRASGSLNCV